MNNDYITISSSSTDCLTSSIINTATTATTGYVFSYDTATATYPSSSWSWSTTDDGTLLINKEEITTKEKKEKKEKENPFDKEIKDLFKRAKKNSCHYFTYIKEYVPFKVYEFTIKSCGNNKEEKIKTICDESDIFDFDLAFALAYAKFLHPKKFTPEGYVYKASELLMEKETLKMIKYGKKLFELLQKQKAWDEEQERLKKERHAKYVEKKKARAKRKKQEEDSRLTNVIKNAIKGD